MSPTQPFQSNCFGSFYHSLTVKFDKERLSETIAHRLIADLAGRHGRMDETKETPNIPHPFERHYPALGLDEFPTSPAGASRLSERFRTRQQPSPDEVAFETNRHVLEIIGSDGQTLTQANQTLDAVANQVNRLSSANQKKRNEVLNRLQAFQRKKGKSRFWKKFWPWGRPPQEPSLQEQRAKDDHDTLHKEELALNTLRALLRQRREENEALVPELLENGVRAEETVAELEASLAQGLAATGRYPLNGEVLDNAILAELGREKLAAEVERLFLKRTGALTLDEALAGQLLEEDAGLLLECARETTASRLQNFTVADAVACLSTHHPNWVTAFVNLVRASGDTSRFSDPEWKNVVPFNRKVMIASPSASAPDRKKRLEKLFAEFGRIGQFSAERIVVEESPDTLSIFSAVFAVPLECTRFYQRGKAVYTHVADELQYHPYPEVFAAQDSLPSSADAATATVDLSRLD